MGSHRIAVLPGDGIGPEVVDAAVRVLRAAEEFSRGSMRLDLEYGVAGYNAIEEYGTNVPAKTLELLRGTVACLKGPMTTPEEPGAPPSAALTIRREFSLYADVRPCYSLPNVPSLKPGIDLIVVRENTEGLYSGVEFQLARGVTAALRVITESASRRVAAYALRLASTRRKRLTYVHKANILRVTDGVFRSAVLEEATSYPDVKVDDLHIDAAAAELIKRPETLDVIVTTNLFGDILSDEASQLVGGLGVTAAMNVGDDYAMFEPVHGSAPKYAGQNKVNPIAMILAAKMMLEYLGEKTVSHSLEEAVYKVLREGKVLTYDLGGNSSTSEVADEVAKKLGMSA